MRGRGLNETEKAENREISSTRARVEHAFAVMSGQAGRIFQSYVGRASQPSGYRDDESLLQPQTLRDYPAPQSLSRYGNLSGFKKRDATARTPSSELSKPFPLCLGTTRFVPSGRSLPSVFFQISISNVTFQKARFLEVPFRETVCPTLILRLGSLNYPSPQVNARISISV